MFSLSLFSLFLSDGQTQFHFLPVITWVWRPALVVIFPEITSEQRPSVHGLTSDWPSIYLHGTGLNLGRNSLHWCPCAGWDTAALLSQLEVKWIHFFHTAIIDDLMCIIIHWWRYLTGGNAELVLIVYHTHTHTHTHIRIHTHIYTHIHNLRKNNLVNKSLVMHSYGNNSSTAILKHSHSCPRPLKWQDILSHLKCFGGTFKWFSCAHVCVNECGNYSLSLALLEKSNCDCMKRCQRQSDLRVQVIMVISAECFLCNKTLYEMSKVKNHSYIVWKKEFQVCLCVCVCVHMTVWRKSQPTVLQPWCFENVDHLLPLFDILYFL